MNKSGKLIEKYLWVKERIQNTFPKAEINMQEFDWGSSVAISVRQGDKRHAFMLEGYKTVGGTPQILTDENGCETLGDGPPYQHELYGLPLAEDPEQEVEKIIAKLKEIL